MPAKHNPPKHLRSSTLEPYTLLSTYDVAGVLGVTPQTVRRKIHMGELLAKVNDSGRFRVLKRDLVAYINALPDANTMNRQGVR